MDFSMIKKLYRFAPAFLIYTVLWSAAIAQPTQPGTGTVRRATQIPSRARVNTHFGSVDLRETVRPTALIPLDRGGARITGRAVYAGSKRILVRVTTGAGESAQGSFAIRDGVFRVEYPREFP